MAEFLAKLVHILVCDISRIPEIKRFAIPRSRSDWMASVGRLMDRDDARR